MTHALNCPFAIVYTDYTVICLRKHTQKVLERVIANE